MLFNIKQETLPREEMEALQLRRLRDLCNRVYANVPFYRKRFDEVGITPADIKSLADLKLLPFTEKQDLRNHYPYGLDYTPCRCGRTHVRISRLQGRSDDMLIIRGVNVFPQQIEGILMESEGLSPNYQIIVDRVHNLDTLEVRVEMNENLFADEIRKLQMLEGRLQKTIKEYLGVSAKVRLMEPRSIERSEGKAKRIVDNRKD